MSQTFAQISDPHLSTLEHVNPRELLNKRALGYLSWRRKRRFEHRPEVLQALKRDLEQFTLEQLLKRDSGIQAEDVLVVHLPEPVAIVNDLGFVAVENFECLFRIGRGIC